jgi:hypothetical protein
MRCRGASSLIGALAVNFDLAHMSSTMHATAAEADAAAAAMGCYGSHKMGSQYMTGLKHGCCDAEPSWDVVDGGYAPMKIDLGDTITFKYMKHTHDVVIMSDEDAYNTCDFTDKKVLLDSTGEGVQDGIVTNGGNALSYVWAPTENGIYYISCTIGSHCKRGQKLQVTVGGDGEAGYVRTGHVSSTHDHSAHDHGDGDHGDHHSDDEEDDAETTSDPDEEDVDAETTSDPDEEDDDAETTSDPDEEDDDAETTSDPDEEDDDAETTSEPDDGHDHDHGSRLLAGGHDGHDHGHGSQSPSPPSPGDAECLPPTTAAATAAPVKTTTAPVVDSLSFASVFVQGFVLVRLAW